MKVYASIAFMPLRKHGFHIVSFYASQVVKLVQQERNVLTCGLEGHVPDKHKHKHKDKGDHFV